MLAGELGGSGCGDGIGADARIGFPKGIARGSDGQLYMAAGGCASIRHLDPATGALTTVAGQHLQPQTIDGRGTAARFYDPEGMVADANGNLGVAETAGHTIRQITLGTFDVTTLAGDPTAPGSEDGTGAQARFSNPEGIVNNEAGDLYVVEATNADVRGIVIATRAVGRVVGNPLTEGNTDGLSALFSTPRGLAMDDAGYLYVADGGANSRIRRIDVSSWVTTTLIPTDSAEPLTNPRGVIVDSAGRLLLTDNKMVRLLDLATNQLTDVAGSASSGGYQDGTGAAARFDYPSYIFSDAPGHAYVSDETNSVIRAVDTTTGAVTTVAGKAAPWGYQDGAGAAATLDTVGSIYSDGNGTLYMTDNAVNIVRQVVLATGIVTTIAGSPTWPYDSSSDGVGAAAGFFLPTGITGDGAGSLYVADGRNNTIRRIVLATGAVTTIGGKANTTGSADGIGAAARFNSPRGITCDGANLYIIDQEGLVVRQMVIASGDVTTLAGGEFTVGNTDAVGTAAKPGDPPALPALPGDALVLPRHWPK